MLKEKPDNYQCAKCGNWRWLKYEPTGEMCRACSSSIGSEAARKKALAIPMKDRIRALITITDTGCWEWQGTLQKNGYGTIGIGDRSLRAHRVAYEAFVGPIPEGLHIDHLCRNRPCCNPEHLEPVTRLENARRAMRTHCVNGHEFTEENIYWWTDGKRYCRECRRTRVRKQQERQNAS